MPFRILERIDFLRVPYQILTRVARTRAGEWLQYSVNVATNGYYSVDLRFAALAGGSAPVNAANRGSVVTPSVSLPSTGGLDLFRTNRLAERVYLSAGVQRLRLNIAGADPLGYGPDIDWHWLHPSSAPPPSPAIAVKPAQGNLSMEFLTEIGTVYYLEYTTNLFPAAWLPATNFSGDGTVRSLTPPILPVERQRFYRIRTQ